MVMPRQGNALFRPHHVDDALIRMVQVIQFNTELVTVFDQLLHLNARHLAGGVDVFGLRGDVVIHGGKGFTRLTNRAVVRTQAIKACGDVTSCTRCLSIYNSGVSFGAS